MKTRQVYDDDGGTIGFGGVLDIAGNPIALIQRRLFLRRRFVYHEYFQVFEPYRDHGVAVAVLKHSFAFFDGLESLTSSARSGALASSSLGRVRHFSPPRGRTPRTPTTQLPTRDGVSGTHKAYRTARYAMVPTL
jgi:hypothetical protein